MNVLRESSEVKHDWITESNAAECSDHEAVTKPAGEWQLFLAELQDCVVSRLLMHLMLRIWCSRQYSISLLLVILLLLLFGNVEHLRGEAYSSSTKA
jgi:hypothetical protein